jgi:hypothetical protein
MFKKMILLSLAMIQTLMVQSNYVHTTKASRLRAQMNKPQISKKVTTEESNDLFAQTPKTARAENSNIFPEVESIVSSDDEKKSDPELTEDEKTQKFIESIVNNPKIQSTFSEEEKKELEQFIQHNVDEKAILKFVEEELSLNNLIQMYKNLKKENELEPVENYQEKIESLSRLILDKMAQENVLENVIHEEEQSRKLLKNQMRLSEQQQRDQRVQVAEQEKRIQSLNDQVSRQREIDNQHKRANQKLLRSESNDEYIDRKTHEVWKKLYDPRPKPQSWYEQLRDRMRNLISKPQPKTVDLEHAD